MKKFVLSGKTLSELETFIEELDEPKFRAKQLHYWLYTKSASSFDEMTNLAKSLRLKLAEVAVISDITIAQKQVSTDGTLKYLLQYPDGNTVETVLMQFDNRPNLTACVSSQVGCAVNCSFCATGQRGFIRNLTAAEIFDQILTIQRDSGKTVTNVVYMGQGEPLLNYDEVIKSVKLLNTELEIGMRRITLSTSGIVPGIYRLLEENRQLCVALSLHAPNHELREQLIPIEKKYHITEVINALKTLTQKTGKRVTIEYTIIEGLNDKPEHAKQIIELLKGLTYNMNLIPYNPVGNVPYKKPSTNRVNKFRDFLMSSDKKVTVRLERGADIQAACGQLTGTT